MRDGRELIGYGMATAIYLAERYSMSAAATLFADGHAEVRCATSDMGPGTYTSAKQVAADALGLTVDKVRFELDDSTFPEAKEHGGSTTMSSVGPAVQAACAALKAKLAMLAQKYGGRMPDDVALLRQLASTGCQRRQRLLRMDNAKKFAMNGIGAVSLRSGWTPICALSACGD
jgi:prepilin-type processing-associated H-X9-DG protein